LDRVLGVDLVVGNFVLDGARRGVVDRRGDGDGFAMAFIAGLVNLGLLGGSGFFACEDTSKRFGEDARWHFIQVLVQILACQLHPEVSLRGLLFF
jgi:hypothetical protein